MSATLVRYLRPHLERFGVEQVLDHPPRVTISEYGSSPTGNVESSCRDEELITELHGLAKLPSSCLIEYDCLLISVDRDPGSVFAERHFAVGAETGAKYLFELAGP